MNWRELISSIYEHGIRQAGISSKPEFYPGATVADIAHAEVCLKACLPGSLRSLLLETNGVLDRLSIDGGEWFDSMWLVWTLPAIIEQNQRSQGTAGRNEDRDLQRIVFFTNAGADGIVLGFPMLSDGVCAERVVAWYPTQDEMIELAPSLEEFLRDWLTSKISL